MCDLHVLIINNNYLRSQVPLNVISQINGAEEML